MAFNDDGFYNQLSSYELRAKSEASAKKAAKKGKTLEPVRVEGRAITKKWWGCAWCENLENYADYESRIGRGKRYVRAGSVIDLKIDRGVVDAKVQGSRATPYKVQVHIDPLSEERTENIAKKCDSKIQDIEDLVSGDMPRDMQDTLLGEEGLFPTPDEIHFACSCPDWAYMCKHVAAVLYGIGVRFDENPLLFFELRGIDPDRFVTKALNNKVDEMLQNADKPSERIMDEKDAMKLFGLDDEPSEAT